MLCDLVQCNMDYVEKEAHKYISLQIIMQNLF